MKVISVFLFLFLTSCAYNQTTINANEGSTVYSSNNVDKPVRVETLRDPLKGCTNTIPSGKLGGL